MTLAGEAREVALAEVQAVQSMARDEAMRERLTGLVAAVSVEALRATGRDATE